MHESAIQWLLCWMDGIYMFFIKFSYFSFNVHCLINCHQVSSDSEAAPTQWLTEVVDESVTVFLEEKGTTINPKDEVERLKKKREETRK